MTAAPKVDVRDLKSVRAAAREPDLLLGDDWLEPDALELDEDGPAPSRRGLLALRSSPIARKIVTINLIALILLIAGVLYLNPSRDNLAFQRAKGLVNEAQLIANVFEAQLPAIAPINLVTADGVNPAETLAQLNLRGGVEVSVFSPDATLVATATGSLGTKEIAELVQSSGGTFITDFLGGVWANFVGIFRSEQILKTAEQQLFEISQRNVLESIESGTLLVASNVGGVTTFIVTTPILRGDIAVGAISVTTAAGEVEPIGRSGRRCRKQSRKERPPHVACEGAYS